MPKPTIVYSVSQGEYSDYRVLAMFETREAAQAAADAMNMAGAYSDGCEVEEFELWPPTAKPPVHVEWRSTFAVRPGEPLGEEAWHSSNAYLGSRRKQESGEYNGPVHSGAWATSWTLERATKAARDRAAALLDRLNSAT